MENKPEWKNANIGIVVLARLNSKRLKHKVLSLIGNKMAIEILLDNVINSHYPVILAIRENKEDDILEKIATEKGVQVYRGQDDSPLHRLAECSKEFDYVVRVTSDDILIDQIIMNNMIKFCINGNNEYVYVKKILEGVGVEIIKSTVLQKVANEIQDDIEYISYPIKEKFRTKQYYPPPEYQFPYRLTLDYEEDLMLLRLVYASLSHPIGTLDIINFLKSHPYFTQINRLPTVTIYTSCYNQSEYIIDCLNSIMGQTYNDFELLIFDDCSTDDTPKKLLNWYSELELCNTNKVKIIRNLTNLGLPGTCNKALEKSRGKYIIRIDSDDIMLENCLQKMVDLIKYDNTHAVYSGFKEVDENLDEFEISEPDFKHAGCVLFSRFACNELKFKDGIQYLEGKEFFNRFNKQYKYSTILEPLWLYRQHRDQRSKHKDHPDNE